MSKHTAIETLVDDATFAESPRWHAGAFWFSDIQMEEPDIFTGKAKGRIFSTKVKVPAAQLAE